MGNRIPWAFQNLSDLHVRCHREKFYIDFLPQNIFESHYTCGGAGKKFGAKSQWKIFQGRPGKKIQKREKNIIFQETLFRETEAIFGNFPHILGVWGFVENCQNSQIWLLFFKTEPPEIFQTQLFSTEPVVHLSMVRLSRKIVSEPKIGFFATLFSPSYHFDLKRT